MKRTIFSIMAVAAVLTGCKETNVDSNSEKGFFVLKSVVADGQMNDIDISTAATKATPAELADVNSFVVKIESNLEGGGTQTFSYSDILDKAIELPTGSYQITAGSPEGKTAAWDQPLFEGVQNFSVVAGATSPVNVKCSLKNAMVSVKCTDTFITELSTFNIKVSANDNDFLTWSKNESGNNLDRQGYFTATELYVQIDGERSLDGSTAALTQTIKNVHPKDHIILNLDARVTGEVQQITLTVDGSVNVRKNGDYIAKMIALAGGTYILGNAGSDENALSTMNMDFESFYAAAKDADVLIYNSTIDGELTAIDELCAKNQLFADFKAVKEGNVWCTGKNMFQETMGLGDMIRDMNAVFADDTEYSFTYLHQLK